MSYASDAFNLNKQRLPSGGDPGFRQALADAERKNAPQQESVTDADIIRAKIAIANADLARMEAERVS